MPLLVNGGPPPGGDPPKLRPYVTHRLACGCVRMSTGAYFFESIPAGAGRCSFRHVDAIAKDDHRAVLVSFCCGCHGYCYCGNEDRLREKSRKAEAEAKAKGKGKDGPDGT